MKLLRSLCPLWLCLPAFLLTAGCGPAEPPKYKVSGQVLLNGKPLTITSQPPLGQVKVQFLPDVGDPTKLVDPKESIYDMQTGKFTVVGLDGLGVEAGKYRVAVYQYDPYPTDKLGEQFGQKRTKINVEVKDARDLPPIELTQYK